MTLAREPREGWAADHPRPGLGAGLAAVYWLGATLAAARAYDLGFHRYEPHALDNPLALTVARDAGLWAATATAAAAFIGFLALLALRQAGGRLLRRAA